MNRLIEILITFLVAVIVLGIFRLFVGGLFAVCKIIYLILFTM